MYIKTALTLVIICFSLWSVAQTPEPNKKQKTGNHKMKVVAKESKQANAKKKEMIQRTLKEKNFHIPDTSKHK